MNILIENSFKRIDFIAFIYSYNVNVLMSCSELFTYKKIKKLKFYLQEIYVYNN